MKNKFCCALLVLCTLPAFSQDLDTLSGSVVFLLQEQDVKLPKKTGAKNSKPQKRAEFGTGFLVADGETPYLVTAQHVASILKNNASVTFRVENDVPRTFRLSQFVGTEPVAWVFHDKEDVAAVQIHPSQDIVALLKGHCMPKNVLNEELKAPPRHLPLTTIGFPLGLGLQEHFSPISRESKAASGLLTISRPDTKKPAIFFLLDNPTIGGFSGAPVYAVPTAHASGNSLIFGGSLSCVGLVTGTISDETGGKMAAITPSAFIVETLNKIAATLK